MERADVSLSWYVGSPRQVLVLYSDRRHSRAIRFLRDPGNATKYHIDSKRIVVIGHSLGGFLAGYAASRDPAITAVAMIAAVNVGRINADPKERVLRLKRWEAQLHPVRGTTASELFSEAGRHTQDWDYMNWAAALQSRPVLLVAADDQNYRDMEALAEALVRKHSADLNRVHVVTDHSFSDRRIALQHIVVEWLNKIIAGAKRER